MNGLERLLIMGALMAPEGEGGSAGADAGGGEPPPEKMLPQSEVNRIAQREANKAARAKEQELSAQLEELRSGYESKLAELQEQIETASMTAAEKAKREAEISERKRQAEIEKIQAERDAAKAAAETWQTKARHQMRDQQLEAAFRGKTVQSAHEDALASFLRSAEIELDDDAQITGVMLGGEPYDLPGAVEKFLASKPHFVPAPEGGTGIRGGNGRGVPGKPLHEMSASELAAEGLRRRAQAR